VALPFVASHRARPGAPCGGRGAGRSAAGDRQVGDSFDGLTPAFGRVQLVHRPSQFGRRCIERSAHTSCSTACPEAVRETFRRPVYEDFPGRLGLWLPAWCMARTLFASMHSALRLVVAGEVCSRLCTLMPVVRSMMERHPGLRASVSPVAVAGDPASQGSCSSARCTRVGLWVSSPLGHAR
jgi:hypothetical protein